MYITIIWYCRRCEQSGEFTMLMPQRGEDLVAFAQKAQSFAFTEHVNNPPACPPACGFDRSEVLANYGGLREAA